MADTENKLNNNETNDFDLEPEISKSVKGSSIKRKVALSTILTQIKDCKNLLEQAKADGDKIKSALAQIEKEQAAMENITAAAITNVI